MKSRDNAPFNFASPWPFHQNMPATALDWRPLHTSLRHSGISHVHFLRAPFIALPRYAHQSPNIINQITLSLKYHNWSLNRKSCRGWTKRIQAKCSLFSDIKYNHGTRNQRSRMKSVSPWSAFFRTPSFHSRKFYSITFPSKHSSIFNFDFVDSLT